jgi:2'-5' RNA ligase
MTIMRLGPTDWFPSPQMAQLTENLERTLREQPSLRLTLGPCWSWSGSVCAHVAPEEAVSPLYEAIAKTVDSCLGDRIRKNERFIPHVTLAYPRDSRRDNEIRRVLYSTWIDPVEFSVDEVVLVKQQQTPPFYRWEVAHRFLLGSSLDLGEPPATGIDELTATP